MGLLYVYFHTNKRITEIQKQNLLFGKSYLKALFEYGLFERLNAIVIALLFE
jgi:hypothetical protein